MWGAFGGRRADEPDRNHDHGATIEESAVTDATVAQQSGDARAASIGRLLDDWQATADPERLAVLVVAVRPMVEAVATRVLRSRRIADRSAVDDVVSLVLDHLRRLPRGLEGERHVALFRGDEPGTDTGTAFIRILARNRAIDVARSRGRRARRSVPFSAAIDDVREALVTRRAAAALVAEAETHDRLAAAIDRLEPQPRTVVQMLLDGKSQTVIAHVLGVCEGTVSRVRSRAVAKLRGLMDE
jgi:RNA polymerase sigma factor (sigma-70 family)